MDYRKLDNLVDSYRDEMLAMMRRWLAVPSVLAKSTDANAPFGAETRRMLDLAMRDASAMGFDTKEFDGYSMHAQMGTGTRTMGILCHLDVVPAGDGWTKEPFAATIENGRIYGRGVVDDKGAAIGALLAMKAVREAGIPLQDGVRLILGCDEETGMNDMRHYASCNKMPDYGFSPDAEFPLINIEKGSLGFTLSQVTGGETGADIPVYELYAGERVNVVPGTAVATIGARDEAALRRAVTRIAAKRNFTLRLESAEAGRMKLTAEGVSAHASTPELGKNAAGMLLIALHDLNAGGGCQNAIGVLAEKLGLDGTGKALGIDYADEESGSLTCNLGILRYDGNEISAQLDIRYPLTAKEESLSGRLLLSLVKTGISVAMRGHSKPHYVPADHEVVRGLLKVYGEVTGQPAYPIAIGGGTYSRCMPNTVAFGLNFPGDPDPCHMPDESVDIDKMMLSIRIMAHAIAELAGKRE